MTSVPNILVLGSLNMDLLLRVPRAPQAGETLIGHSLALLPGGKGGNQAVGCARQGAQVRLLARIGRDADGEALRAALAQDGIALDALQVDPQVPTGRALVMLEDSAQNRIVVLPGANAALQCDEAALAQHLQGVQFFVTQLESPLPVVLQAVAAARRAGCPVLLNPSPMQPLPDSLWPMLDTLVVNEIEAAAYAGCAVATPSQAAAAGQALRARGVARVVVTLGAQGAVTVEQGGCRLQPAPRVQAIDTTAAGDTFAGALAVALASGQDLAQATARGVRAAAVCVTRVGAQVSIPSAAEVDAQPEAPTSKELP
ncbi:ribokinase [Pseudorhodoferax sp. Leaf274]|uniref:ribokinase n=1 Tax=Pseudorhodoferax sp. Leaf274 TaxID=1736318 RepID=UPI000703849C|nr:ribokinase [Pseudorhodoferax sp. Leaf274]KQP40589.1 ribokinase [Pseudorhodoferax sp. Leaf274]